MKVKRANNVLVTLLKWLWSHRPLKGFPGFPEVPRSWAQFVNHCCELGVKCFVFFFFLLLSKVCEKTFPNRNGYHQFKIIWLSWLEYSEGLFSLPQLVVLRHYSPFINGIFLFGEICICTLCIADVFHPNCFIIILL